MSGYTDEAIDYGRLGTAFVEKPFSPDMFARKVREGARRPTPAAGA